LSETKCDRPYRAKNIEERVDPEKKKGGKTDSAITEGDKKAPCLKKRERKRGGEIGMLVKKNGKKGKE